MKKYLLPKDGKFYKANLHSHSTISDGKFTPEQMKEEYKKRGYSIIAFTDHNVFLSHNELTDDTFLALNGFEGDVVEDKEGEFGVKKTCHACYIALDKDYEQHPFWHRGKYSWGNALMHVPTVKFDESEPDYERSYTPESINDMIRRGKEKGFFVTYNHPRWSLESYPEYSKYEGMDALEIYNGGCFVNGYGDYVPFVYDDLLRQGKKIFCIATDDNHNNDPLTSPRCDSFRGFTYIKAKSLSYADVAKALKNGDFYASTGAQITELWYDTESKTVHIECSGAKTIFMNTATRNMGSAFAEGEQLLTSADFTVKDTDVYFRITVNDENGFVANSNAYFLEDL